MVLAYAVDLEAELVGEFGFCNDLSQSLAWRHSWIGDLGKCRDSKFHGCLMPQSKVPYSQTRRGYRQGSTARFKRSQSRERSEQSKLREQLQTRLSR